MYLHPYMTEESHMDKPVFYSVPDLSVFAAGSDVVVLGSDLVLALTLSSSKDRISVDAFDGDGNHLGLLAYGTPGSAAYATLLTQAAETARRLFPNHLLTTLD